jgi:hypothetical protein
MQQNDMDSPPSDLQTARALWQQGHPGPALASVQKAIQSTPDQPEPWEFAGYMLVNRKKWAEAQQLLTLAVQAFPSHAPLHAYHAIALAKTGQLERAYNHATLALQQQPDLTAARLALIEILCDAGYYDLALQHSRDLPTHELPETAAFCQGSTSFLTGDTTNGMKLLTSVIKDGWRGPPLPEWTATANDQHVILYNGQAFGDLIQFIRYLERAEQTAGKVTLHVPPSMEHLIRDSFPNLHLTIETNDTANATSRYSICALAAFDPSTFDPYAHKVPYLRSNPKLRAEWHTRLAHLPRPHIGIVWSSPWGMNNPFRTVNFETLKPILDIATPNLVSLQMGPEAKQATDAGLFDATPFIKDFADSAALMDELDLVISLDSAPAHLAGALDRPVWTFLPFNGEWRWLIGREDCIWYPTMRLFRQNHPQEWKETFEMIAHELKSFLAGDNSVLTPKPWNGVTFRRHPNPAPLPGLNPEGT